MESVLYIGLDAGGSKTKALSSLGPNQSVEELLGPGSNPSRLGRKQSTEIILSILDQLIITRDKHFDKVYAHLGIAGMGGSKYSKAISDEIETHLRERHEISNLAIHCLSDIELNAKTDLGDQGGCSVILGTGSSFMLMDRRGSCYQGGGWGYLLGDEGSGFAIALSAIRHAMACIDCNTVDAFSQSLMTRAACSDRSDLVKYTYAEGNSIQELGKWVVERSKEGDDVAEEILTLEFSKLIDHIAGFIDGQNIDLFPRVVLNGGMAANPEVLRCFKSALNGSALHSYQLSVSKIDPAEGALILSYSAP